VRCKDIPERPILEWLKIRKNKDLLWGTWCQGYENSVPFPDGIPPKLRIAKMAQMIKKGIVSGCPCGCRGDYEITDKGLEMLALEIAA
jgi:hypothetical protein